MAAPLALNVLADDRNASARVLLDVQDGDFVVLLDRRPVAICEDAAVAMEAFRAIRRAVERHGERL